MSLPTPQPTANTSTNTTAPTPNSQTRASPAMFETVSIVDLENGKVNIDATIEEVHALRSKIAELRYQMALYMKILSCINDGTAPAVLYQEISNQVQLLKGNIDLYYNSYKRLLPVIRYAKIKTGINPEDHLKVPIHKVAVDPNYIQEQAKLNGPNTNQVSPGRPATAASSMPISSNTPNNPLLTSNSAPPVTTAKKVTKKRRNSKKAQQQAQAHAQQAVA
ncbi:unnamed protein product [Ambrosiozyma monospora]|uniref:Unnamed protein product n=1 Tax=Ambrosiozyma monospora TaxID=43982 RepID=A0A9W7DCL0_AMBMO|nr:unnamed protein product [Ambrosiozyma monospora]